MHPVTTPDTHLIMPSRLFRAHLSCGIHGNSFGKNNSLCSVKLNASVNMPRCILSYNGCREQKGMRRGVFVDLKGRKSASRGNTHAYTVLHSGAEQI